MRHADPFKAIKMLNWRPTRNLVCVKMVGNGKKIIYNFEIIIISNK